MAKVDFKKEWKHLYQPPTSRVVQVDVPPMNFLMIDGEGDPASSLPFQDAIEALFSISYTLKFMIKKGPDAVDYGVMPLEALWWADDMTSFSMGDKSKWKWTVMVMQPGFITEERVEKAIDDLTRKGKPVALPSLRFQPLSEGKSAQIMHIGPFSQEGPTIQKMHTFIHECGCDLSGKHHEIYLSDMRRADPARWKTVLRQPMT